jgi:hypothetical protein
MASDADKNGKNNARYLAGAVHLAEENLWPTPDTRGFTNKGSLKMLSEKAGSFEEFAGMAYRQGAKRKEKLWPTPRMAGMCGGTGNWEQLKKMCSGIEEARKMGAGNGGQLNPDWVEALMGYPLGWTDTDKEDSELRGQMYLSTWRDGTWEKGIPRIVHKAKNRTKRLKGLGNAVVPQIMSRPGLKLSHEERKDERRDTIQRGV